VPRELRAKSSPTKNLMKIVSLAPEVL